MENITRSVKTFLCSLVSIVRTSRPKYTLNRSLYFGDLLKEIVPVQPGRAGCWSGAKPTQSVWGSKLGYSTSHYMRGGKLRQ